MKLVDPLISTAVRHSLDFGGETFVWVIPCFCFVDLSENAPDYLRTEFLEPTEHWGLVHFTFSV